MQSVLEGACESVLALEASCKPGHHASGKAIGPERHRWTVRLVNCVPSREPMDVAMYIEQSSTCVRALGLSALAALAYLTSGCEDYVARGLLRIQREPPTTECTPLPLRSKRVRLLQTGVNLFDVELRNFEAVIVQQKEPLWCWAASAEMISRYIGSPRRQEDIVAHVDSQGLGYFWDRGANESQIQLALAPEMEGEIVSKRARDLAAMQGRKNAKIVFKGSHSHTTNGDDVVEDLSSGTPVLVGLAGGRWGGGHVVVAYGVNYSRRDPRGQAQYQVRRPGLAIWSQFRLNSMKVIDPMPDGTDQRVELSAEELDTSVKFFLDHEAAVENLRRMLDAVVVQ